jgi:plastocyanin
MPRRSVALPQNLRKGSFQMRTRLALVTVLAAALAAVLSATALARPNAHPKLIGVVGKNDAYSISLAFNGKIAKTLKAGTYTIVIHDDSQLHNYELDGPHGTSWTFTQVPFVGTKTVTLKLVPGAYKAYCSLHESEMFQHFTVR